MSMIEQFVYTASPWGKSDPGWMVFRKSSGIDESVIVSISSYYRYARPDGWDGAPSTDAISSYPVQFVFAKPKAFGGDYLLAQTKFTGQRWYDPRPGDWYVHGFRIPASIISSENGSKESPLRFFMAEKIQREYPEDLRKKATLIEQKRIPWEAPPDLPTLDSLDDLEPDSHFEGEVLFSRIPEGTWSKLGALLAACVKRNDSAKAFVFDATKSESLDTMAAILALMPQQSRAEAQFSTYFHLENVRETKADETFLFYGTVREGESADPDTGLYGALPEGGPDFRSREDVELFKRMVDAGGTKLKKEDFDDLVLCWEVAAGRRTDVESLRKTVQFAERFPGMKDEVVSGLENTCLDPMATVVAWFELNLAAFEGGARQVCDDCVCDGALFAEALRTLDDDAARKAFADAVAEDAEANGTTAELAKMWLGCPPDVRALLARNVTGPFVSLAALADRFDAIRRDVAADGVERGLAAGLLNEADRAAKRFGGGFDGMEETRNALRYLVALDGLNGIEGLSAFARAVRGLGVDEEKVRTDVLDRVKPGDIPVERLAGDLDAFEVVGIQKEDLLRLVIEAAERRGRDEGERSGRQRVRNNVQPREDAVACHRGLPPWIAAAVGVAALGIGLGSGYFFGASRAPGKDAVTENREPSPPPPVPQPQKIDLPIVQHDDSLDFPAQSSHSPVDEHLQSTRSFPSQSQQMSTLDSLQMPATDSPEQSQQKSSASRSTMSPPGNPETDSVRELQVSPSRMEEPEPTPHGMPHSRKFPETRYRRTPGQQANKPSTMRQMQSSDDLIYFEERDE